MPFHHTPREEATTLPDGTYEAAVMKAEEKQSKNGNDMLEVLVKVFDDDGASILVTDYLVNSDAAAFKIRHFCVSAGIEYDSGEIDTDALPGTTVYVKLKTEKSEQYGDRNKIADYVDAETVARLRNGGKGEAATTETAGAKRTKSTPSQLTDDVPF